MRDPSFRQPITDHSNGLPFGPFALTILNPQRRTHVLACYENITYTDADELVAIYRVLGYADTFICLVREEAAA
jgi:hypothetical protein